MAVIKSAEELARLPPSRAYPIAMMACLGRLGIGSIIAANGYVGMMFLSSYMDVDHPRPRDTTIMVSLGVLSVALYSYVGFSYSDMFWFQGTSIVVNILTGALLCCLIGSLPVIVVVTPIAAIVLFGLDGIRWLRRRAGRGM